MTKKRLQPLDKFLLSNTGVNLLDGSNWGFCSIEDFYKYEREIKTPKDEPLVDFYPLKDNTGVLVNVNSFYMFNVLTKLDGLDVSVEDIEEANTKNMEGSLDFRLFLEDNKEYQGFIGVNETTDSKTVSISQVLYPSFRVNFKEVIKRFKELQVEYVSEENKWVRFKNDITEEEFVRAFTISPTRNCMVLPIRLHEE